MAEELQPVSGNEQEQATPKAAEVQPEVEMVPVSDLRKVQGAKDREVTAKTRELAAATARAQAAEQRLSAIEASMEQLATQTMGADEAQAFIGQRRQQSQLTSLQQQAAEGQKFKDIVKMAQENKIPVEAFDAVLANPGASYADAQQVVTEFYQKQLNDLRKQQAKAEVEAKTVARKVVRQERSENGSDAIGAPAEPTAGSPDLEAQYLKEKSEVTSQALAGRQGMFRVLQDLKEKYRKLGLNV